MQWAAVPWTPAKSRPRRHSPNRPASDPTPRRSAANSPVSLSRPPTRRASCTQRSPARDRSPRHSAPLHRDPRMARLPFGAERLPETAPVTMTTDCSMTSSFMVACALDVLRRAGYAHVLCGRRARMDAGARTGWSSACRVTRVIATRPVGRSREHGPGPGPDRDRGPRPSPRTHVAHGHGHGRGRDRARRLVTRLVLGHGHDQSQGPGLVRGRRADVPAGAAPDRIRPCARCGNSSSNSLSNTNRLRTMSPLDRAPGAKRSCLRTRLSCDRLAPCATRPRRTRRPAHTRLSSGSSAVPWSLYKRVRGHRPLCRHRPRTPSLRQRRRQSQSQCKALPLTLLRRRHRRHQSPSRNPLLCPSTWNPRMTSRRVRRDA